MNTNLSVSVCVCYKKTTDFNPYFTLFCCKFAYSAMQEGMEDISWFAKNKNMQLGCYCL